MPSYNLRKAPRRTSKGQRWTSYVNGLKHREGITTPRTSEKIYKERTAAWNRQWSRVPTDTVLLANELVSGGRPPEWYIAQHQQDLFDEWEKSMGKQYREFKVGKEYVPWYGMEVRVLVVTDYKFGMIDMRNPIQGRSMVAKRIDGKEVSPEKRLDDGEMSWREWRKFSRACNLLLEAVDGMPWGWEMEDEECEKFSKAPREYDRDLTRNKKLLGWTAQRIADDIEDEEFERRKREVVEGSLGRNVVAK